MGTLPDWRIEELVTDWEPKWARPAGPEAGWRADIPDPGPLVSPFDPGLLGPASLDMRLGKVFESGEVMEARYMRSGLRHGGPVPATKRADGNHRIDVSGEELDVEIMLRPGQTLICVSAEYYRLPPDVEGELYTKSSAARADINHSTASMIHPGFHGAIAFELVNLGKVPRPIRSGARIVQIKFTRMEAAARTPYFEARTAKYRGQTADIASRDTEGNS